MNKEIMQQALEALLHMCNTTKAQNDYNAKMVDKALVALEAALAQPEQRENRMTDREAMLKALDALEILNGAETVDGIFIYTTDLYRHQ